MKLTKWFRKVRQARAEVHAVTLRPESHNGRSGVSVFEDGHRVAWAASETAALAAYQVSRAA